MNKQLIGKDPKIAGEDCWERLQAKGEEGGRG